MNTLENIQNSGAYHGLQNSMIAASQDQQSSDSIALADFNRRAQAEEEFHKEHAHHVHKSLAQRRMRPANQRPAEKDNSKAEHSDSHDDGNDLDAYGAMAVDALIKGGETHLEGQIVGEFDILERHSLLRNAHEQVDKRDDLPDEKKSEIKNTLNGMISKLVGEHGDVIKQGVKATKSLEVALDSMQTLTGGKDEAANKALSNLRKTLNEKGGKKVVNPLTPQTLAKRLQETFGEGNFSKGLESLRSKMAAKLHDNQVVKSIPRIWLSLSDAACFNAVQSSYAIAGNLHRDLSKHANILPQMDQGSTAVSLLGAPTWTSGGASGFTSKIVGSAARDNQAKLTAYSLCQKAVATLPETLWGIDKMSQRMSTLDELKSMANGDADRPMKMEEDRIGERLRGNLAAS